MKILAIETSMGRTSVALAAGAGSAAILTKHLSVGEPQAEQLIPLISQIMSEGRLDFSALEHVAVCIGPGGFSGIRTGVAAARGIGLAADIPVIGVTSFSIMAAAFHKKHPGHSADALGLVAPAGLNMVFCQILAEAAAAPEPIQTIPHSALADFFAGKVAFLAGPFAASLVAAEPALSALKAEDVAPDAAMLIEVARGLDPKLYPPTPYYARPADAKPQTGYSVERKLE